MHRRSPCFPLPKVGRLFSLAFLACFTDALVVDVMVASRWSHRDRRNIQRTAIRSCARLLPEGHSVELFFFMGDFNNTDVDEAQREQHEHGDLVQVGGPDSDPPVVRDATYVLERPCARTHRLAHGSRWLANNRPDSDFVFYLDDDSYLNLPRLFEHLQGLGNRGDEDLLAMGYTMETNLDWTDSTHICELCIPCEICQTGQALQDLFNLCAAVDISHGACFMAIQNCRIFNEGEDMLECVATKVSGVRDLAAYFGSKVAPRWMLGMGWMFGSKIVKYIGRNADRLKTRGAADVMLGYWLAPLEGVRWQPMNDGRFHDHPATKSTFAAQCSDDTVLVHRVQSHHWEADFDPERCVLTC